MFLSHLLLFLSCCFILVSLTLELPKKRENVLVFNIYKGKYILTKNKLLFSNLQKSNKYLQTPFFPIYLPSFYLVMCNDSWLTFWFVPQSLRTSFYTLLFLIETWNIHTGGGPKEEGLHLMVCFYCKEKVPSLERSSRWFLATELVCHRR